MTNYADPNAFLMGGGAKSAKFDREGDKVVGTILDMQVKQQTDIKTGAPRTWDNGDPMMQLVVTLQTDARDDEDDDGRASADATTFLRVALTAASVIGLAEFGDLTQLATASIATQYSAPLSVARTCNRA